MMFIESYLHTQILQYLCFVQISRMHAFNSSILFTKFCDGVQSNILRKEREPMSFPPPPHPPKKMMPIPPLVFCLCFFTIIVKIQQTVAIFHKTVIIK